VTSSGHDVEPPPAQYIEAQRVMVTMGRAGVRRITHLARWQVFLPAMIAGLRSGWEH
jgi:hypothetical protein